MIWASSGTLEAVRNADLGSAVPVVFVEDEEGLAARMPPALNPLGYFLDIEAVRTMSTAMTGLVAARSLTFPPIVVWGEDAEAMRMIAFNPNSRVAVSAGDPADGLRDALRYWTRVNVPLE